MYQHIEREKKTHFMCGSCGEHPVAQRGGICGVCQGTVADWSAEAANPLPRLTAPTQADPGTATDDEDGDEGGDQADLSPIVRKPRISYKTDFELVILRHSELRRAFDSCPDLDRRLREVGAEIEKAVKSCWGKMRYRPILTVFGINEGDLHTLMTAWAAIYIGLYEKKPEQIKEEVRRKLEATVDAAALPAALEAHVKVENQKLLAVHLRQKFTECIGTLYKKLRDCVPDREVGIGFSLSQSSVSMGRPFDLPAKPLGAQTDSRPQVGAANADLSYRRRHQKLRTGSEAERRRDAKRLLEEGLAALTHDELKETLEAAAKNDRFCPDSQRQAKKMLTKVQECTPESPCAVCQTRNRAMDKAILGYPQANSLPLVRAYTLSLIKGQRPFVEALGVVSPESLSRHTAYYRHAARVLGFAAENRDGSTSPTRFAFDLARTAPGSEEERALFLQQATTAPSLREVAWFFETMDDVPSDVLAEIIVQEKSRRPGFDHVNPATAERRVSTLFQWKAYIHGEVDTEQEPVECSECKARFGHDDVLDPRTYAEAMRDFVLQHQECGNDNAQDPEAAAA